MKLWFDAEHKELVTEDQLRKDYEAWLPEMVKENGLEYVVENAADFTFEGYQLICETDPSYCLIPVYNCEKFTEVKPNEENA